ncbi:hypothetical protein ACLEIY_14170 [Acetobacter tropicalis]|uniref:Uncharacterized protein n=2 Tax=Acetobacter TaxID=434 RepID=A0A0U5EU79_9PROT|nr:MULTISPECIES: hypothetical protein [Acetobacter]ATJ90841.1 hypothetical protein CIW82_09205 [Acetobacter tropicalis]MCC6105738.1 hypothetical protein [Acetobacter sp.]MCP1197617.1 hypothetical protein [Acetobacter senegalensis]MDN7352683.1 hypothetical protein [Acetobacter senegalensis]MDN7353856.1 hypothetical protein [Acetobacter senegalensis]
MIYAAAPLRVTPWKKVILTCALNFVAQAAWRYYRTNSRKNPISVTLPSALRVNAPMVLILLGFQDELPLSCPTGKRHAM